MTEINVFDAKGKIVFRSVEPRLMTEEQVQKELRKHDKQARNDNL